MIPFLHDDEPFPPVESALRRPNGLLAAGGDLSSARLLDAYARGVFPWFDDGDPVLWWSPDPRMVLPTDALRRSRSLRRTIRSGRLRVTADCAFAEVVEGCAAPRAGQAGTWISHEMAEAYTRLFDEGHAHSVEVWAEESLVGGLYGVGLGRMFFGESMFSRASDASKVALAALATQLARWEYPYVDCQLATAHLASLGAREMPRAEFLGHVGRLVRMPGVAGPWRLDVDLLDTMGA